MKTIELLEQAQPEEKQVFLNEKEKHQEAWQQALSQAVTNPKQLLQALQLDSSLMNEQVLEASNQFRTFVTESFLNRMGKGDPNDPLFKQVWADPLELLEQAGFETDPLDEKSANPVPGLLHKYHGRVLIITNSHCAINCRFCFRRSFPYSDNHFSSKHRQAIFDYLKSDPSIEEVILSGGDPLLLNNARLTELLALFESVGHIKRLRIHSRIPIVLPSRITQGLINCLKRSPLQKIMVIHSNHPQEFNEEVSDAMQMLHQAFPRVLNQSVLLKGINDNAETLISLQNILFEHQIQSYYLHTLDKVKGTGHFDLPLEQALSLYQELQARLPGYMLPRLVTETAGKSEKTLIC